MGYQPGGAAGRDGHQVFDMTVATVLMLSGRYKEVLALQTWDVLYRRPRQERVHRKASSEKSSSELDLCENSSDQHLSKKAYRTVLLVRNLHSALSVAARFHSKWRNSQDHHCYDWAVRIAYLPYLHGTKDLKTFESATDEVATRELHVSFVLRTPSLSAQLARGLAAT